MLGSAENDYICGGSVGDFSGLDFAAEGRRALFKLGYDLGQSGAAWVAPTDPSAEAKTADPAS